MKTIYTCCLFYIVFFTSFTSFAQKNDTIPTAKRKIFAIGFSYEAKYCYRKKRDKKSSIPDRADIDYGELYTRTFNSYNSNNETAKYGYSVGLSISCFPTRYFGINIGANYSTMGYKTKLIDTLISGYMNYLYIPGNTVYDTSYNQTKFNLSYTYFTFPFSLEYIKRFTKIEFLAGTGLSINLLKSASIKLIDKQSNLQYSIIDKKDDRTLRSHLIYYNVHIGIYYYLNERFVLGLVPSFNYQKEAIKYSSVHLYSFGSEFKLLIKL